jgi:hypothetical protein
LVDLASGGSVSSTTAAWFTLAGALGGVLLTGSITLITAILNHRWQMQGAEQRRLLDHGALVWHERSESYVAYWRAWNRLAYELGKIIDLIQELPQGSIVDRHLTAQQSMVSEGEHKAAQGAIDKTLQAELEWRTAADALLLTAYPELEEAAREHVAMTERKLASAWAGRSYTDTEMASYRRLSNAMQAALLTPIRAEQWLPMPLAKRQGHRGAG